MSKKGFTLIELMVVVLIVGILAAVAVPMMKGRIDAAKWSEGKAGAGTIATALRAYASEKGTNVGGTLSLTTDLGFSATDLNGAYFNQNCYSVGSVTYTDADGLGAIITVNTTNGTADKPSTPGSGTLTITKGKAVWADGK